MATSDSQAIDLPSDVTLLQGMIQELIQQLQKSRKNEEQLRLRLDQALRRLYSPSSEKSDPNQLSLIDLETLGVQPVPEPELPTAPRRRRRRSKPVRIPDHLPRVQISHTLPEAARLCPCCEKPMEQIRTDTHTQLDYEPAKLFVVEHEHAIYACRAGCDEAVRRAPKAAQMIEKGLPGAGLLAQVIINKFADHLPLYRQEGIFQRLGVEIPRSSLGGWVKAIEKRVRPLVEWMRRDLCRGEIIWSDDTTVPVLAPGTGKTRTGYLWVYLGDENHPWVLYQYTRGRRGRDGPDIFLRDFQNGYLQADGYSGYNRIYARPGVQQAGCWMHGRRYFLKALEAKDDRALEAIAMVRELYKIEKACHGFSHVDRLAYRKKHAVPMLDALEAWMDRTEPGVLPKSPMGAALTYARNQWDSLCQYTKDGRLPIDNGESERNMRRVAIGRKNWLFAGSDAGGKRAAGVYSLVGTCGRLGLDANAYLRWLFQILPGWSESRIHELTPLAWAREQGLPVRTSDRA